MDSYISRQLKVGFDYSWHVLYIPVVLSFVLGLFEHQNALEAFAKRLRGGILRWTEGQAKRGSRGSQHLRGLPTPLFPQVFSVRLGRMEILRSQARCQLDTGGLYLGFRNIH